MTLPAAAAVDRSAVLREMEGHILRCIRRVDTTAPLFHGCIDWHSAAHGHWALFRVANALGEDRAAAREAEARLTDGAIARERALLAGSPAFENPYGRAWFLRLVMEFEAWGASRGVERPDRLRAMGDEVAASLFRYYETRVPSPLSREYENASWAFYHLASYLEATGDAAGLARADALIDRHFVDNPARLGFGSDTRDFFSRYGNWVYLVARTRSADLVEAFLRRHPVDDPVVPVTPTTDHSLGLNWSRAWALAALGREAEYESHVARGWADHFRYRDDYRAYGHWVPQFAVYALTAVD